MSRARQVVMVAAICVGVGTTATSGAQPDARTTGRDYEALIFDAVQYATTPQKRARKQAAREELFTQGPKALHEVMQRMGSKNVMVGVLAQELVEQMSGEQAAPVLAEFLSSTNADVRRAAAFFLGFHQAAEYAPQVRLLLQDPEAAGAAMRTLGKWRISDAIEEVAPFLYHEREIRRIAAINALRDIGDPRAIRLLEPCLRDRYFTVRRAAARAIRLLQEQQNTQP